MKERIKMCTRCNRVKPHHHELDEICMDCEMEECYPEHANNPEFVASLNTLKACTSSLGALEEMKQTLEDYKPLTVWGAIKELFR